jgi:hypothetical protein
MSEVQKASASVERRCNTVEQYLRDQMNEQKGNTMKIIGSTLLAVFSAIISAAMAFFTK